MLRFFVLSLICSLALGGNVAPRQVRDVSERILGGDIVQEETKYPSKCVLRYQGFFHCGCSILDELHILSTARCARMLFTDSLSVHVGSNHIAGGEKFNVASSVAHPDFVYENLFSADIAVLKLADPLVFSDTVGAAELPPQDEEVTTGSIATMIGWGFSAYDGPLSPSLMEVNAPIIDWQSCANFYSSEGDLSDGQICTSVAGGVGVCHGDEGSALFIGGVLHGLTTWTSDNCAATQGFPSVYTNVAMYSDWIATQMAM